MRENHPTSLHDRQPVLNSTIDEPELSIPPPPPEKIPEEEIIEFPYIEPEFPGGKEAMYHYFSKNVKYPIMAKEMVIQGTVYVQFKVMQDGSIEEETVVRGVDSVLDEEAMRVVRNMPKWAPAAADGRRISRIVVVPLRFKII